MKKRMQQICSWVMVTALLFSYTAMPKADSFSPSTGTVTTNYGKFTYEVTETKVLPDTDTSLLYYDVTADPPVDDLILYTCWNNGYMGLSDQRLYVICKVVSKEYKN